MITLRPSLFDPISGMIPETSDLHIHWQKISTQKTFEILS